MLSAYYDETMSIPPSPTREACTTTSGNLCVLCQLQRNSNLDISDLLAALAVMTIPKNNIP